MNLYAQMATPLGDMLLSSNGGMLTGAYFIGQKDCPLLDGLPPAAPASRDPTAGLMHGMPTKRFKAYRRPAQPDLFTESRQDATVSAFQYMQPDTPAEAMAVLEQACRELTEYFAGTRRSFSLPLQLQGTEFQKRVWQALLAIPYGEYVSYGDVAAAAGLGRGHGRPVGTAVGRNPLTIIVPCHRVLSSTGRLNGYTGGLNRKYALLELEGFSMIG
ncbi:MAG TPA: methylated-DNA--[protein]-cysteine S-methyltransferase [Burkholderiaceae bacterium]|nr:methylated-DNA--[protein]-cysteine S-methyltransferase [Burkholderiaceae bacterium]